MPISASVTAKDLTNNEIDKIAEAARTDALNSTQDYYGKAFDWRSEDAGRWAQEYPRRGVILGAVERKEFLSTLQEWIDMPLKNALLYLDEFRYIELAWRTKKQVEEDQATIIPFVFGDPQTGSFWSGVIRPKEDLIINEGLIRRFWNNADRQRVALHRAVALADAEYLPESQFYSIPDGSPKISDETLADAKEHPEKYALVFLDYHW